MVTRIPEHVVSVPKNAFHNEYGTKCPLIEIRTYMEMSEVHASTEGCRVLYWHHDVLVTPFPPQSGVPPRRGLRGVAPRIRDLGALAELPVPACGHHLASGVEPLVKVQAVVHGEADGASDPEGNNGADDDFVAAARRLPCLFERGKA